MEIKALDKGSVHRLCSGQVVLTFATAVKELLENSLDAGAKNITIRLKSSGLELIEVADDGCGVEENNFQALTLKHFTSKLSAFTDLTCVQTFGFRGEALSSLCALSDVSMSTCTRTSKGARRVSYDHTGKVTSVSVCHREPGTTVMVENLFSTLPVRRKELEKNVTKEFNKMVTNISGYCLLCEGVKLTMTNQAKNKGSSTTVLKINSNLSAKENIIDVFGVKQWSSLRELKMVPPDDDVLRDFHLKPPLTHHFVISGFLSSAEHGKGRSSNDRQFLFVNKRPFDNPKLLRLVNEVYHSFNSHQSPFVLLNINTPTTNVDVNVTPDKRQVFMHDEKVLLAVVKASLRALYINTPSLFTSVSSSLKLKRTLNSDGGGDDNDLNKSFSWSSSSSLLQSFKRQKTLDDSLVAAPTSSQDDANNSINNNNTNNNNNNNKIDNNKTINFDNNMNSNDNNLKNNNNFDDVDECLIQESSLVNFKVFIDSEPPYSPLPPHTTPQYSPQFSTPPPHHTTPPNSSTPLQRFQNHKQSKHNLIQQGKQQHTPKQQPQLHHHHTPKQQQQQHGHSKRGKYDVDDDDEELLERRRSVEVEFSMEKLRRNFMKKNNRDEAPRRERRFKAELTDNQRAEEELKRSIDKASFQRMQVLGQFNLGFIITLLDRNHLFIIDQHATDEKYNFEWLEKNVVLKNQKLIRPQRLELTVCNESILLENLDVFSSNGFEFMVDHAAPATQRVSLVSIPTSRDWLFGQQDIQEMIFMLSDAPKTLCRPSRIRQMLASRACRKSVMIGTALQHRQMLKIVRHMALMQQPWNCPHGRPTIRHLIDLNMVNQP